MLKEKMMTAVVSALLLTGTQAKEFTTTDAEQTALNVTIYNNNTALIKDTRKLHLPSGTNTLAFRDVSGAIQPETISLNAKDWDLLEQNFEYDVLTEQTLINKNIGKPVTIETTDQDSGKVTREKATILSNNNGVILKIGDEIRSLGRNMSIIYDRVPSDLRDQPTVTMLIDKRSQDEAEQTAELTYLSHQMNWKADYIANLNDDKTLNLTGWVTLTNHSGATYRNANLQLVAGEVNRVRNQPQMAMIADAAMMKKERAAPNMAEESLFEYHLYTLGRPTTIKDKQQKQVALLSATAVPYQKQMTVIASDPYGWRSWGEGAEFIDLPIHASLVIDNKATSHLGLPLPAGIVRSYKKDSRGNAQFIGEAAIKHTPKNEQIKLALGKSFDLTAKRKQTEYSQARYLQKNTVKQQEKKVTESVATYEVIFKNPKDSEELIAYQDQFYGNWIIEKQSLKSDKINSNTARWRVNIPAKSEVTLTYTVKITQ